MANAREKVLLGLYRVENQGAYCQSELTEILNSKDLPDCDRAFVSELFMGVVRHKLYLDHVIAQFSSVKLKKLNPWIHAILRMGVYQLLLMDRIPDSAACNESVKMAAKQAKGAFRGFVNGVLRNVARQKDQITLPTDEREYLSVRYSCPLWLVERLLDQYDKDTTEQILAASLRTYPVSIRTNGTKTTREALSLQLEKEGVNTRPMEDHAMGLWVEGALNIHHSKAYAEGLYTLQNGSSMAAVEMLSPKKGERVLDMCAAPGGKTTYMAEQMEDDGKVLACDVHPHKIPLLQQAAKRLDLSCIEAMVQDGTILRPEWQEAFDRVLADVPCSGIGVIHKKPDIKWNRKKEDIEALCAIQEAILENAAAYVKKGGVLVYATCTILKQENQDRVRAFLENHKEFSLQEEKQLQTFETGGSGFYMARLVRQ